MMISHVVILYSLLFIFHCSGYNNYCQRGKPKCVKSISITKKVSEDLQIQRSQKCRLETRYYEGQTKSNARYVILVLNNSRQFLPAFHSMFQKKNKKLAFSILMIKMGATCHDLIKNVILALLLDENSQTDRYMLLAVLVFQQKHLSLINYLNLLLLDEIPIISFSTEELRYEETYFKNFISFKAYHKFITKFLFNFLRKENIKSMIIVYTSSVSTVNTISGIQARLKEERTPVCRSEIYNVNGKNNKTELILKKIREHTFATFIVIVSSNAAFSKFVSDSLRQSKITKNVFLYGKNYGNHRPAGNVKNLLSIKAANIGFELFPTYLINAIRKTSDALESLSAFSFKSRVLPKNISTIFATSIREDGSAKNVKLKMVYKAKGKSNKPNEYGLYTIDPRGNETLSWYSNTTLWNETFYHSKNCLEGFYPIYKGADKCRWICIFCESGFYKSTAGQGKCLLCNPSTSLTNANRTKCLPFDYQYYQVKGKYSSIVKLLATLGFLYSLSFLVIFVRYRNTPVVKSSNVPLTFTQIVLHVSQSCQILLTLMKQNRTVCLLHSVTSGNALKLIIAIWMIKTNQILSVFRATSKVKRKRFVKLSEIAVPSIFIICNILMNVAILTQSSFQFGIYEITSAFVRLKYCKMSSYFYIDSTAVIFLSIICSIKAFHGRHLPSNYNEMKYIFLSMFTLSMQLALSLILHANFQREGIVMLVDSILLQFSCLSVLSITYGYRVYIILFQRHKNTTAVFRAKLFERIHDDLSLK